MALLKLLYQNSSQITTDILKSSSVIARNCSNFTEKLLNDIKKSRKEEEMPVKMENPFTREKPQCILCKHNIEPNFKNIRLLSQFVSTYTGRIYGRHITGLCKYKQETLEREIKKAQSVGLMGCYVKNPKYLNDPDLYDPAKPPKFF